MITGSSIVHSMCPECIQSHIKIRKTRKKKSQENIGIEPIEKIEIKLKTLKEYLEMEI